MRRPAPAVPDEPLSGSDAESEYVYAEEVAGAKHLGVWPLAEAAQTCVGQAPWLRKG